MNEDMTRQKMEQTMFAGMADELEAVARFLRSDRGGEDKNELIQNIILRFALSGFCEGYQPPSDRLERLGDLDDSIQQALQDFRE